MEYIEISDSMMEFIDDLNSMERRFNQLSEKELIDLFWKANCLSFEDKQKLVTYLNTRGHNLKLFRGEMRGELHYTTEYFDGESWKEFKRDYEA
jgi:hypothetical protein